MKYILWLLLLTGCSTTVPVTAKFPEPPKYSLQPCPQLQELKEGAKLSDVANTVTINYTTYYNMINKIIIPPKQIYLKCDASPGGATT